MIRKRIFNLFLTILILLSGALSCSKSEHAGSKVTPQSNQLVGEQQHNQGRIADTLGITRDSLMANIQRQQAKELAKAQKELVKEALEAIQATQQALDELNQNKIDQAFKSMEKVLGKLELILGRNPELALVPIDAKSKIINLVSDLDKIEMMRKEVENLIEKGYFQDARRILDAMVSEIRISITNIPLETYPQAIKLAAHLIEQDNIEQAKSVLSQALSTIVIREISIPIPVINAQAMLDLAADSVETNPQRARELLKDAQYQLKVAEALGYGHKDKEFKEIIDDMETIKQKIDKKEKTSDLFDSLKARLQRFKERISK